MPYIMVVNGMDEPGIAPYVMPVHMWSGPRLQLMILLSALFASLTGLVTGERPVERAPVELSAAVAVAQSGIAARQAGLRPENRPSRLARHAVLSDARLDWQAPVRSVHMLLLMKQSWLN